MRQYIFDKGKKNPENGDYDCFIIIRLIIIL